jgi:DNA-binding NtrC family response regulator
MNAVKVMIVDDQEEILKFFFDVLNPLDYRVLQARNGMDALKIYKSEKPDIVFLDIRMPVLDGIETLKKMKCLDKECKTTVIMVTGWGDMTTARQAMRLGAYDYITKPVSIGLIHSICKEAVAEKVVVHA